MLKVSQLSDVSTCELFLCKIECETDRRYLLEHYVNYFQWRGNTFSGKRKTFHAIDFLPREYILYIEKFIFQYASRSIFVAISLFTCSIRIFTRATIFQMPTRTFNFRLVFSTKVTLHRIISPLLRVARFICPTGIALLCHFLPHFVQRGCYNHAINRADERNYEKVGDKYRISSDNRVTNNVIYFIVTAMWMFKILYMYTLREISKIQYIYNAKYKYIFLLM